MFDTTPGLLDLALQAEFLMAYVAALRPQGMGGWLRGGIVTGQTGMFQPCIHLNCRFQKGVSMRNMSGYRRWIIYAWMPLMFLFCASAQESETSLRSPFSKRLKVNKMYVSLLIGVKYCVFDPVKSMLSS